MKIMKTSSILFFLLYSFLTFGQQLPNSYFSTISNSKCDSDTSVNVKQPAFWKIYQTKNDAWDGIIDSSYCISLDATNKLQVSQFNNTKPLFLKCLLDSSNKVLLSENSLFNLSFSMDISSGITMDTTANKTQIMMQIEIPDSAGNGKNYNSHQFNNFNLLQTSNIVYLDGCFSTDNFDSANYITSLVIQLSLTANASTDFIKFRALPIDQSFGVNLLEQNTISNYNVSQFKYYNNGNSLVMYQDSTYPSAASKSYLDLAPIPNVDTVSMVTFLVDEYSFLSFQSFTELRGGLVLNDSTKRHNINYINNGGDVCLDAFIEIRLHPGDIFEYKAGNIDFGNKRACMMFDGTSTLKVAENTTFHYGTSGKGMLALKPNMNLDLGENAELKIYNTLVLMENEWETTEQQLYITLNEGETLTFEKDAHISNAMSINKAMKLNIYMKGGTVNYSNLPQEEQKLVHLIYQNEENNNSIYDITYQNPTANALEISLTSLKTQNALFSIYDLTGKEIISKNHILNYGKCQINKDLSNLKSGIYFFHFQTNEDKITHKFIKL